jgi:hypothetical protein
MMAGAKPAAVLAFPTRLAAPSREPPPKLRANFFTSAAYRVRYNRNRPLEWADRVPSRKNKTRNNRRPLVSGACRSPCSRRKIDKHRSALTPAIDARTADK